VRSVRITNDTRGVELAAAAMLADTRWTRLRGLLARPRLRPGEGIVITPSHGVHTYGMRYAIDVVLTDREGRVTGLYPGLEPGRHTRLHREAAHAVELAAGTIVASRTRCGDRIRMSSCSGERGRVRGDE
jgi:uncharacterized membrane protein (UPF0127 family)